jgi:FkbM family methyltransferase
MEESMKAFLKRVRSKFSQGETSYAQFGEDIMIRFLLRDAFEIADPTYLDVGANHPTLYSNTYLLYRAGHSGICVEPDPQLCNEIKRARPRDNCLPVGIGISNVDKAEFFIFDAKTLNTFSQEEAEKIQKAGQFKLQQKLQVPLVHINDLIDRHASRVPDLVSLDTEGFDVKILQSFDFKRHRPAVFCVETLTYPGEEKILGSFEVMEAAGYLVFAETYINTLFVDEERWSKKRGNLLRQFNDYRFKR